MDKPIGAVRLKSDDRWMVDLRPHGRIYSLGGVPFIGDQGQVVASAVLEAIQLAVGRGSTVKDAASPYAGRPPRLKIKSAFRRYLSEFESLVDAGDRSAKTLSEYRRIGRDEIPYWEDVSCLDLTKAMLNDWSISMALRELSPKSRKNYLGALRACLSWMVDKDELSAVPAFPNIKLIDRVPKVLPREVVDQVLSKIAERNRGPFLVAAYMGLRPGEVRALEVSDIDRSNEAQWRLSVTKAVQGPKPNGKIGPTKNRRERVLPIPNLVRDWLEAHVDWAGRLTRQVLFTQPQGGRISHGWLYDQWWQARQGITDASLYVGTKHSFASDALNRGIGIERIQKFLGHSDIRSTQKYAKLNDSSLDGFGD